MAPQTFGRGYALTSLSCRNTLPQPYRVAEELNVATVNCGNYKNMSKTND